MSQLKRILWYIYSRCLTHKAANFTKFSTHDWVQMTSFLKKEKRHISEVVCYELKRHMENNTIKFQLPFANFVAHILLCNNIWPIEEGDVVIRLKMFCRVDIERMMKSYQFDSVIIARRKYLYKRGIDDEEDQQEEVEAQRKRQQEAEESGNEEPRDVEEERGESITLQGLKAYLEKEVVKSCQNLVTEVNLKFQELCKLLSNNLTSIGERVEGLYKEHEALRKMVQQLQHQ